MILEDIDNLIQEVEEFSTIERIFRYGPIKTFGLWIWRVFNMEILDYFEPLLNKIEDAVNYFDTTDFKASKYINKVDLGELMNMSKLQIDDMDNSDRLVMFRSIFTNLNKIIVNLLKAYIDQLMSDNISLNGITSINSLLALKNNDPKSKDLLQDISDTYSILLTKKPTSALNIISELKRRYLDSKFINEITSDLDKNITQYVSKKLEVSSNASVIRNTSQ